MPGFTAPKKKKKEYRCCLPESGVCGKKLETIQAGYSRTGQYPVEFRRTLSVSKYSITLQQSTRIMSALPSLRQRMAEKGQISEEFMDSLGIVNVADKEKNYKPNDEKNVNASESTSNECRSLYTEV